MSTFLGVHSTKNLIEILHLAQLDLIQAFCSYHWPFKFICELLWTKNIEIQSSFLNFLNFWSNFLWNEVNKKLTTFIIPPLQFWFHFCPNFRSKNSFSWIGSIAKATNEHIQTLTSFYLLPQFQNVSKWSRGFCVVETFVA